MGYCEALQKSRTNYLKRWKAAQTQKENWLSDNIAIDNGGERHYGKTHSTRGFWGKGRDWGVHHACDVRGWTGAVGETREEILNLASGNIGNVELDGTSRRGLSGHH